MTYYSDNRERMLQYNINYYWNHREEKLKYNAMYWEKNKEKIYYKRKQTQNKELNNKLKKSNMVHFN